MCIQEADTEYPNPKFQPKVNAEQNLQRDQSPDRSHLSKLLGVWCENRRMQVKGAEVSPSVGVNQPC